MHNKNDTLSNIIYSLLLSFFRQTVPLVIFVYSNRVIGAEGIGHVSFSKSIASYFCLMAMLGVKNYGIREVSCLKNKEELSEFFWDIFIINFVSTFFSLFLFLLFIKLSIFSSYQNVMYLVASTIILSGLNFEWLYIGLEKFRVLAYRNFIVQLLSFFLLIFFVKSAEDVGWYTIISILSVYGCSIFNFFGLSKYVSIIPRYRPQIKRHIRPIMWLFAFALSIELYTVLDTTMLGIMHGDGETGLYTVAMRINKMIIELIMAIVFVFVPQISRSITNKSNQVAQMLIKKIINIGIAIALPSFVGMLTLSEEVIVIFAGNDFQDAFSTLRALSPIIVIITIGSMLIKQVLIPLRKERCILVSTILAALVNITMNAILIPAYGRNGAAFATVVAECAGAVVSYIFVRKYIDITGLFSSLYQYLLASLCIPIIKYFASLFIRQPIIVVFLTLFISIPVYLYTLVLLKNSYAIYGIGKVKDILNR